MAGSLVLFNLDEAPIPLDNLFFALLPDAEAAEKMASLAKHKCREHGLKGKPLLTSRFHVTLLRLGQFAGLPTHLIETATSVASEIKFPPFRIEFDCASSFGKRGDLPFVLGGGEGVEGVSAFQQILRVEMARTGLGIKSAFTPHVTLLYDSCCVPKQNVDPVGWKVRDFVLVRSLVGRTKHIILDRWPLIAE